MSDFPTALLVGEEDSKHYGDMQKDPGIRKEIEGGYVVTRKRFTRAPRHVWTTGFTMISEAEKDQLQAFWVTQGGTADTFTWTEPTSAAEKTVRFMAPMQISYVGMGPLPLYNVRITLEEA